MIRVTTTAAGIVLLAFLFQPAASALAGDREGPSDKEVKQMIEFGISLGKQGLWKEALYRWREALRYDPENPKLYNNIAVALESQGDLEGARESYQRAEELAGRAKYIARNIEDFEELFTALEQYEAQYREPPTGTPDTTETQETIGSPDTTGSPDTNGTPDTNGAPDGEGTSGEEASAGNGAGTAGTEGGAAAAEPEEEPPADGRGEGEEVE